jgi:hypothetical protein
MLYIVVASGNYRRQKRYIKVLGKRLLGRPRLRWNDNIKLYV